MTNGGWKMEYSGYQGERGLGRRRKRRRSFSPLKRAAGQRNILIARRSPNYRPPRPHRSAKESAVVRSLVWHWHCPPPSERQSARALAKKLGCSHTWINLLRREFLANPERQERSERNLGPGTLAQLREEQAKRRDSGFALYRVPRPKLPKPSTESAARDAYNDAIFGKGYSANLRQKFKAEMKRQQNFVKDYGHPPEF